MVKNPFKKPLSLLLACSLLASQQGFFVPDAAAALVAAPQVGSSLGSGAGITGAAGGALHSAAGNGLNAAPSAGIADLGSALPGTGLIQPVLPSAPSGRGIALSGVQAAPTPLSSVIPGASAKTAAAKPLSISDKGVPPIGAGKVYGVSAPGKNRPTPNLSGRSGTAIRSFAAGLGRLRSAFGSAQDEGDLPIPPGEEWDNFEAPEAGAPKSLSEITLEPIAGKDYFASPEDWRDESIYFPMIDRFARAGDYKTAGPQVNGRSRHGGNLKGVIEKLDYIQEAGFTTVLLTPVALNSPGGYHGYWPINQLAIDPNFGTMADFKKLVDEAHKRGMRVILDMVLNHTGPIFEYKDGPEFRHDGKAKEVDWTLGVTPKEFQSEEHFYRRGVIGDWDNPDEIHHGDFPPNLRHYNADNERTRKLLAKTVKWWIKEADIDGFRLDAYKHIKRSFWLPFLADVRGYAKSLGKEDFLMLGEISSGIYEEVAEYVSPEELDTAFNYPAFRNDDQALHGEAPTNKLEQSHSRVMEVFGKVGNWLVRFFDNQDAHRFLREKTPISLLKLAVAHTLFATGIPMIYYGTEQAFRHIGYSSHYDPGSRNDMFAGEYKFPGQEGDQFKTDSKMFRWTKALNSLRREFPALRRGEQYTRWSDPYGAGIYAFSRIYENEEVVVVMNTSNDPRSAEMWVDAGATPVGTTLNDALDPGYSVAAWSPEGGGSKVYVEVPPHGVRVLVKRPAS